MGKSYESISVLGQKNINVLVRWQGYVYGIFSYSSRLKKQALKTGYLFQSPITIANMNIITVSWYTGQGSSCRFESKFK